MHVIYIIYNFHPKKISTHYLPPDPTLHNLHTLRTSLHFDIP